MEPGLCASCRHARRVAGARSVFWRCGRAEAEPRRYPRFPRLPVVDCPGFEGPGPDPGR